MTKKKLKTSSRSNLKSTPVSNSLPSIDSTDPLILKNLGNEAFVKNNFEIALKYYSRALDFDSSNYVLYSNRSATFLKLNQFEESLKDAERGIEINPQWSKNYYRKAEALFSLKQYQPLLDFIQQNQSIEPSIFEEIRERTKKQISISIHFKDLLADLPIDIIYFSEQKGKGIVSKKSLHKGQIIFEELPFVCVQKTENMSTVLACHHCVKFLGIFKNPVSNPSLVKPPFAEQSNFLVLEPISCSLGCNKVYCSKECEQNALQQYHKLLCPRTIQELSLSHPIIQFEEHAISLSYRFLLISKILAMIQMVAENSSIEKAEELFQWFTKASWEKISHFDVQSGKFEQEIAAAQGVSNFHKFKSEILQDSLNLLKSTSLYNPKYSKFYGLEFFSQLMGMIDLNAANIESLPPSSVRKRLSKQLRCPEEEVPFSSGMGLFTLHSCLNHSCKPNAQVVGGLRDSSDCKIRIVALRPIEKNEEIFITYIEDENKKDSKTRQNELKGGYLFNCDCIQCKQ